MKPIFLVSLVVSFSFKTHRYLGNTLCSLNSILNDKLNNSCGEASIWADKVKRSDFYKWTSRLHYTGITSCQENYTKEDGNKDCGTGCILSGILNTYNKRFNLSDEDNTKLFLHLTQDLFQPLHLYGIFRGGNNVVLTRNKNGRNKTLNLHQLLDGEIFNHFLETENYIPPSKTFCKNKNIFFNMEDALYKIVNNILPIGCEIYNRIPETKYIIFEDFYDKYMVKFLLDSYFKFTDEIFTYFL